MKCEINGCNQTTDTFLCIRHQEMAQMKNAVFKICNGCNCIVNIEIKIKPKGKHVFVDKCETCNFFK